MCSGQGLLISWGKKLLVGPFSSSAEASKGWLGAGGAGAFFLAPGGGRTVEDVDDGDSWCIVAASCFLSIVAAITVLCYYLKQAIQFAS